MLYHTNTHTHTLRGMELNPSQLSCFLDIFIFAMYVVLSIRIRDVQYYFE